MKVSDFTLKTYEILCISILDSSFKFQTVYDSIVSDCDKTKIAIMRHDVDAKPLNSLRMAQMEASLGIKSTYYFRMQTNTLLI